MIERRIGIDFGTSTTIMAFRDYEDGKPKGKHVFIEANGSNKIPTVIFEVSGGEKLFGKEAEECQEPGVSHVNFKMDLASEEGETYQQALALTEDFFRYMQELYEAYLDDADEYDQEITYISYPAKWKPEVIEDMKVAVGRAGFKNVRGMDEPTAAVNALVYQNHERLEESGLLKAGKDNHVLMIDMGAGTMDLVYCTYCPGDNKPLKDQFSWPESQSEDCFGGREIDEKLIEQSLEYLLDNGKDYSDRKETLRSSNKIWKEGGLSKKLKQNGRFSSAPSFIQQILERDSGSLPEYPVLDRKGFEMACGELLDTFPKIVIDCGEALKARGIDLFEETDLIVLTGGNSAWYFIEDYLKGRRSSPYGLLGFKKIRENPERIFSMNRPQETVAFGLALNEELVRQISKRLSEKSAQAIQSALAGTGSSQPQAAVGESQKAWLINVTRSFMSGQKEQEILKEIAMGAQRRAKEKKKDNLYYKKMQDLRVVVNYINMASVALEDRRRVIAQCPYTFALYLAVRGADGLEARLSLSDLYEIGMSKLLSFSGSTLLYMGQVVFNDTIVAPTAPVTWTGGGIFGAKKALIKEKGRLLHEAENRTQLLQLALKQEIETPEERKLLLIMLRDCLFKAQSELALDLAREGA